MVGKFDTSDKLEFRQIVLGHIKKILEISSRELRDDSQEVIHSNFTMTSIKEDTRISYLQAIENLAYILIPHFDKDIKKIYDEEIKIITGFDYEIKKLLKKEYEEIKKETKETELGDRFIIEMKIKSAKKLFVGLNLLLKRNQYLKSSIFGEDEDEEASDDEKEIKKKVKK